jgi:transaldolase
MNQRLKALSDAGVSVWLDDISRKRLCSSALQRLIDDQHGVTSNPTVVAKAASDTDNYAGQLRDLAVLDVPVDEAARMITAYDVRRACNCPEVHRILERIARHRRHRTQAPLDSDQSGGNR